MRKVHPRQKGHPSRHQVREHNDYFEGQDPPNRFRELLDSPEKQKIHLQLRGKSHLYGPRDHQEAALRW